MGSTGAKRRILIIDDEEGIRVMLETRLFKSGFNVDTAGTGLQAMQKIRSGNHYDLIICDLKMPGMSGGDVFAEIVKLRGEGVPFLLLTGFPERDRLIAAVKNGVDQILLKPVRFVTLMEKIDSMIGLDLQEGGAELEKAAA
jgi:DNA-binding response OmpR family regulator